MSMVDETSSDTTITQPKPEASQEPISSPEPTSIASEALGEAKAEPEQAIPPEIIPMENEAPKVTETPTAQTPVFEPLNSTSEPLGERVEIEVPEVKPEPVKEEVKQTEIKPIPESRPEPVKTKLSQKDLWKKFLDKVQIGKRKKLEKIMTLFLKKKNITNDEVEKYLHVSDATATRYLNILGKENKIKQVGKTGKGVSYSRI